MDKDFCEFPSGTSKGDLCARYGLDYKQLRDTFPEDVKKAVNFRKKRKFGPKETSILFAYLDPDRYAVYLKRQGENKKPPAKAA